MANTHSLQRSPSWVVVSLATGKPVLETFSRKVASNINTGKYWVVPILEYLGSINKTNNK